MSIILDEVGNAIYPHDRANGVPVVSEENLVDRQGFLETIERMFVEVQVVFLEGNEGYGASTLSAQFCAAYPDKTFCIFIKPFVRTTYSPDYVRLSLAEQITWFLEGKDFHEDSISVIEFRKLIIRLAKKTSKKNPAYFVIDGLHKLNPDDLSLEEIIRDILPLWQDNMKFLISGKQEVFSERLPDTSSKYINLLIFSFQDVHKFMCPLSLESSDIRTIHTLCQGIPGRLASVRRLMLSGTSLQEILDSSPEQFPSFLKLEFSKIDYLSAEAKDILATIVFSGRQFNTSQLMEITKLNSLHVDEILESCPFVVRGENDTIDFVSDAHRRLASSLLETKKNSVINQNVDFLLTDPNSKDSINYLPLYFQQLNKASELVKLLNPGHFAHLLEQTSSLGAIRARSEIGMIAAVNLEQPTDVLVFSLMQSFFLSVAKTKGSKAHIRALVALGDHQTALSIAFNCVTKEERIKFLATYAKKCMEITKNVDAEIIAAIQLAAKSIDFSQLGEAAIDIASEIVHVDQDIALSIMDDVLKGASTSDRDAAYVKMSLEVSKNGTNRSQNQSHEKISDTKLKEFVASVLAVVSEYSVKDVLSTCDSLDPSRQLSFLGYWIGEHKENIGAIEVTEHGLKLMISNSAYLPKMRELRELAMALPYSSDKIKVGELVRRFDSQKGLIQDLAMSIDTVGLQMGLAHAETIYDIDAAASRIIDCYVELSDTKDIDTKLQGFVLMLKFLSEIEKSKDLEKTHNFKETIVNEITPLIKSTLENSAEHFSITSYIISQFAVFDVSKAIEITQALNTEDRRDKGFSEICQALHGGEIKLETIESVKVVLSLISHDNSRWDTLSTFLHNISLRKVKLSEDSLVLIEGLALDIKENFWLTKAIISIIRIRVSSELAIPDHLFIIFRSAINNIFATYSQSTFFFEMTDAIAVVDNGLAKQHYKEGMEKLRMSSLPTQEHAQILTWVVMLCSRAIGGAAENKSYKDEMTTRFLELVELIPTMPTRVDVISDLASRLWIAGRADVAKHLMGNHILSLMDSTTLSNLENGRIISSIALPVLYCTHPQIAMTRFKQQQRKEREFALAQAFDLIVTKSPKSDPPILEAKETFILHYSEILDSLALIELMEEDWNIYYSVRQLGLSISDKKNVNNLTAQQKSDVADKIRAIYSGALPDKFNIRHDGYVILCEAYELRIRANNTATAWESIISRAKGISNVADQGYILCDISALLPPKMAERKQEIRYDALSLFNQIPSTIDKITRLIGLSDGVSKDGISLAKQALRSAMVMTLDIIDNNAASEARRRIIDIADKIKPEFADELADLLDTDSARKTARAEVKARISMLSVKKKISNVKDSLEITRGELQHLPEASWKNLLGLIADRLEIKAPQMMTQYLETSSRFTMREAFPVAAWFIENISKKYIASKDSTKVVYGMVDSLLLTTEFLAKAIVSVASRENNSNLISVGDLDCGKLIGLNNRVEILAFIESWLSECDEEIILCDPYFGVKESDLEFFRLMLRACPNSEISVLTSKKTLQDQGIFSEDNFLDKWRQHCDLSLPVGRILSIGTMKNEKCAIHDRWLISGNRGLKLGTSFNGIGAGKLSGISALSEGELRVTRNELQKFLNGERLIDGERISYSGFTF